MSGIVPNNSGLWCQRKTTQSRLENENSEPQMWDKHCHVVIFAVSVILNLSNVILSLCNDFDFKKVSLK